MKKTNADFEVYLKKSPSLRRLIKSNKSLKKVLCKVYFDGSKYNKYELDIYFNERLRKLSAETGQVIITVKQSKPVVAPCVKLHEQMIPLSVFGKSKSDDNTLSVTGEPVRYIRSGEEVTEAFGKLSSDNPLGKATEVVNHVIKPSVDVEKEVGEEMLADLDARIIPCLEAAESPLKTLGWHFHSDDDGTTYITSVNGVKIKCERYKQSDEVTVRSVGDCEVVRRFSVTDKDLMRVLDGAAREVAGEVVTRCQCVLLRSGGNNPVVYSREAVERVAREQGWAVRECADGEVEAVAGVVESVPVRRARFEREGGWHSVPECEVFTKLQDGNWELNGSFSDQVAARDRVFELIGGSCGKSCMYEIRCGGRVVMSSGDLFDQYMRRDDL